MKTAMTSTPITNNTSLRDKPLLRRALLLGWAALAVYIFSVVSVSALAYFNLRAGDQPTLMAGLLDTALTAFDIVVDVLISLGFTIIAVNLLRRSDDWMALFTSMFMLAFVGRISNLVNNAALVPGYEALAGTVLVLGDLGIVTFNFLFPNGRHLPRPLLALLPLAGLTFAALYIFPNSPLYWASIGQQAYLLITLGWYSLALAVFFWRYHHQTNLTAKQQMRFVLLGLLGPLLWFIIFNLGGIFLQPLLDTSWQASLLYEISARIASLALFLSFPFFIMLSIVRSRLFDIDLLINRSMVYGGLTVALGLVFALLLGAVSFFFRTIQSGDQSMLAMTLSALTAGALFQPARRKLQRFVDRYFYRIEIDYQKTPASLPQPADPLTDTTLSSYRGLRLIARGGMADVYRAEDPTQSRPVAIKVLPASMAADEQFRRRFLREAQAVAGLNHPNIVHLYNFGEEKGTYFIVMEYLSGPDLRSLLKEKQRLTLQESLPILRGVASALDYAHSQGLIHRDIKPSNILLDFSRPVLTDFGIAKIADAHTNITATGVLGTFDYISPEQIQSSAQVTASADIYSLGVMTYQLLTGHLPFERPNTGALLLAHLTTPPPDAREILPDLPRLAAHALQRALDKTPTDRYPSAGEFVAALEGA